MTSTQYQNFVAVVECRSITGAAKQLRIAQPALTSQIKRIEEAVGTQLIIRHTRFIELTDAGKIFYQSAKTILQMEENYTIGIKNLMAIGGTLKLGITPFLPDPGFQDAIESYYCAFPSIAVDLYEENTIDLLSKLEAGILELVIVISFQPLPSMFEILHESNSYLYACRCSENMLLDTRDGEDISFRQLQNIPLCVPRAMYHTLEEFSKKSELELLWKSIGDTRHATLQLAKSGNMVAVLALRKQIRKEIDMVCNRIIDKELIGKRYVIKMRERKLSTAAKNFLKTVNLDLF